MFHDGTPISPRPASNCLRTNNLFVCVLQATIVEHSVSFRAVNTATYRAPYLNALSSDRVTLCPINTSSPTKAPVACVLDLIQIVPFGA